MMHKVRDVRRTHQKRSAEDIDTEHKGTDTENEEDYGRIALFPGPVYERVGEGGKKGRQKSPPSRVDDKNARSGGILPVDGIKHQPIDSVVPVERINETSDITSSFPNSSPSLPGRVETVVTITYSLTTGQLITPKSNSYRWKY
uniref:Uncharacterized protein n=1 Tax=Parascaris equorum TaxID=6256 RepID=A0A914S766_PAREQ